MDPSRSVLARLAASLLVASAWACGGAQPAGTSPALAASPAASLRDSIAERWRVAIELPDTAEGRLDPSGDRVAIDLVPCPYAYDDPRRASCRPLELLRRPLSGDPADEARRRWDEASGSDVTTLDEGITSAGVRYAIRAFRVRVGSEGIEGQTVHRFTEVARVFADLALDDGTQLACTGYVEHAVESVDDTDVRALREACLSMQASR